MKNTAMKKLAVVAALSCACAVAWAENVLYIKDPNPDATGNDSDWYFTYDYAFADKIDSSLSIAIWVKDFIGRDDIGKFIAGVATRWSLQVPSGGTSKKLRFSTESGNVEADSYVVNDGKWHFLVGTFNYDSGNAANSFQRLYVDGELVAESTTGIKAISSPDRMFSLGAAATDMTKRGTFWQPKDYSGYFAELSIWNRALTETEVSQFYSSKIRLAGNESGLVAYWPLTGELGTVAAAANLAQTTGVPNLEHYYNSNSSIVEDDDLTLQRIRYVASSEWCAANEYVQSENATGHSWNDPLTNLVEVASAAMPFERILCSPGTHKIASPISPLVENFYLGSCDPATDEPCPDTAIIDAQELCRHFTSTNVASHKSNFTIENLTFVNGHADQGGSMRFRNKTGKISNCIFHDNAATSEGGAYYAHTADGMVVSNCQFYGNSAVNHGGAVSVLQSATSNPYQRFVDCIFTNNTVTSTAATSRNGGAVRADLKIELENCFFSNNSFADYGNGGHASIGQYSIVRDCVFTGSCKAGYGACLSFTGVSAVVTNCVFGGLSATAGNGVFHFSGNKNQLVDCVFTNNTSNTTLFRTDGKESRFRQCLIADNASSMVVMANAPGSTVFENCTIPQEKLFPATISASATNTFVNCILPNATITSAGNYCNILSNCCVKALQNGPFDSNVWTFDPRFVDAEHGDYTLELRSLCRESGLTLDWMTAGATDLLGRPRVVDRLGVPFAVGALPDLGCYEVQEGIPQGLLIIVK